MAADEKYESVEQLVSRGKEKGYVLYDEVTELIPSDLNTGGELEDLLANLDGAGIDLLEEPRADLDKKPEDGR